MTPTLDAECAAALKDCPSVFVPWFLATSLCYYKWEISVISDNLFDHMCKDALKAWPRIKHRHRSFIKRDMLSQGSGYNLPFLKLPTLVWHGAGYLVERVS